MDPRFFWTAHLVGVLFVFLGLGVLYVCALRRETSGLAWKTGNILNGTGLLLTILFGFARMHSVGWPLWGFAKLGLWLVLAAVPVLMKKKPVFAPVGLALALASGSIAIYLVYWKPF